MRVLVADDEEIIRELLGYYLPEWGYEVVSAVNGHEALEIMLAPGRPEIALLDWQMPGATGLEVCRRIKADEMNGYCYVMLLTGKSGRADIVTGLDAGADDYLIKPADETELRSRLAVGSRTVNYERLLSQKNQQLDAANQELDAQNAKLEKVALRMARLAMEREVFSQVFRYAKQEMAITDPEGVITHVNPAFERKYGYPASELVGRNPALLNPGRAAYKDLGIAEEDYEARMQSLWKQVRDPKGGHWEGVLANRTRDGGIVWVQLLVSALRNTGGELMGYVGIPLDITEQVDREANTRIEFFRALTDLAERRDNETGAHLRRVAHFSTLIAETLGMPARFCSDIGLFAPMHDIGKVGIPDDILLAPRPLTPPEFEVMKNHATICYEILRDRPSMAMGAEIALTHHEWWNGNGYPQGLKGDRIPVPGRIVALVDVYDALRSERCYKAAWPHAKTRDVILGEGGTHFDPDVAAAFGKVEQRFEAIFHEFADEE